MREEAARTKDQVEEVAHALLQKYELFKAPIDPIKLSNELGIKVYNAKFSEDNISGLVAKRDNNIVILVSQGDSPVRKRFTIAHELGHHLLHMQNTNKEEFIDKDVDMYRSEETEGVAWSNSNREEVEANNFAAALLMPRDLVKQAVDVFGADLSELARHFNVSEEAIGIRLSKLGF